MLKDTKDQFEQIKDDPAVKVIAMEGRKKKEQERQAKKQGTDAADPGEELPGETESDKELNRVFEGTSYIVRNGCLIRVAGKGDRKEYKTLTNFVPIPVEELTRDDGMNIEKFFTIYGKTSSGMELREVTIPAERFNAMNWLSAAWGFAANCLPGTTTKDYLRHAIVEAGGRHAKRRDVYCHTGWRMVRDKWVFLYSGGAVGDANISVELEGSLYRYKLPDAVPDYKEAARTSLELLNIAPKEIMIPLLAYAYLTPLNEFFRKAGIEPAFVVFLLGMTGAMKSTIAALILSHFGEFNGKSLPASFKDTPNALEKYGFLLKDMLTVIDDYHPTSTRIESQKMEQTAQSITRAYGDRTARTRMNSDTNLKLSYIPRGNMIMTGEDTPNIGQSGNARHLILELKRGDVNKDLLTSVQEKSSYLSLSMRGYIEWLTPRIDELPGYLKKQFVELRKKAQNDQQHARMPETVAWLQTGFIVMLNYFSDTGVISQTQVKNMLHDSWELFKGLASRQNTRLEEDKPTRKFIDALRDLLDTSKCHTIPINNSGVNATKMTGFIGYEDDEFLYLHSDTAYNEVFEFYKNRGENFPITKGMLIKQLSFEKMILVDNASERREKVKKIGGKSIRLLWMYKNTLKICE